MVNAATIRAASTDVVIINIIGVLPEPLVPVAGRADTIGLATEEAAGTTVEGDVAVAAAVVADGSGVVAVLIGVGAIWTRTGT